MPVYRTKDGRIVEEKTKLAGNDEATTVHNDGGPATPPPETDPSLDAPTRKVERGAKAAPDDEHTRVVGGSRGKRDAERKAEQAEQHDATADPVAGWLVVVQGAGRGNYVPVRFGANAIGRGADQPIALPFGDDEIGRESHAILSYDPRGRRFYLQPGTGRNLVYLGDQPVLAPTEIESTAQFQLGSTTLRLIALCGPDFDWSDSD